MIPAISPPAIPPTSSAAGAVDTAPVQLDHVTRVYGSRRAPHVAVDDVSLLMDSSTSLGIVGESGSGKSTLAKMLVGLEHPSTGAARFRGRPIHALGRADLMDFRRSVQLIAQDTSSSFDPRRTLRDALRRPTQELMGMERAAGDEAVDSVLHRLEVDPRLADRRPHQVSGGQRQRFAIARALVVRPRVIVCDEVVSALDVSVQGAILNVLKRYRRDERAGLVFVSHGLPATAFLCDRLMVMHNGHVVEEGPTRDVVMHSRHEYTAHLIAAYRGTAREVDPAVAATAGSTR
jgi:peptide/nickel transport system ATP-binding protein